MIIKTFTLLFSISRQEIEQFLNFNEYTIKSPFREFPNTAFYDYDICRYIDAGISFDLINVMLESI